MPMVSRDIFDFKVLGPTEWSGRSALAPKRWTSRVELKCLTRSALHPS